ncbi:MAG TPA: division/cell wall cluster transcriptional repressor MraZ [Planctomycetota bacterium]|nr:division/cell wall cluster transcriptional repressor MraZ [Planctomycetota bacterium]
MWTGESTHTLDSKYRVFLPKRLQDGLGRDAEGNLTGVLSRGFEDCLFLYSDAGFQRAVDRLQTQAFSSEQQRLMQRLLFSDTYPATLDTAGRLLLPESLRALAQIQSKEVVVIGLIDRIELWDKTRWADFKARNNSKFNQLDRVLATPAPAPGT